MYTYESAALGTRLSMITNVDLSRRNYLYANPLYLSALTGIQDENGVAYVTWGYDSAGLANSSTLTGAGGSDSVVKLSADSYSVVDPTGQARTLTFSNLGGRSLLTAQSQPAGAGCAASSRAFSYDANGNVASQVDFNGIRSCYSSGLDRNLQIKRVEGLAGASTCDGVLADGAALPASSRKFTTEWHPEWRLPTRSAGPGVITNDIYNGQPDPFNGGTLAACAPATALLPDGKPIAVLCRRVEQATSDTDGSLGFSAPLAAVATADQRWTYNQDGQVLAHDGPRTDVADVTYYAYYSDTTADHTRGDLQTLTNAAGHVSNYLRYNAAGQLLTMVDPNGVTTTNIYDLRQRLTSTTVGGLTTVYTYDLAGQLVRVTNPDGAYAGYTYDAAHRLIAAFDNLGNRIDYTLDATGKRTAERVNDESGVLRRQLSRSFDALGRPQQITGRE